PLPVRREPVRPLRGLRPGGLASRHARRRLGQRAAPRRAGRWLRRACAGADRSAQRPAATRPDVGNRARCGGSRGPVCAHAARQPASPAFIGFAGGLRGGADRGADRRARRRRTGGRAALHGRGRRRSGCRRDGGRGPGRADPRDHAALSRPGRPRVGQPEPAGGARHAIRDPDERRRRSHQVLPGVDGGTHRRADVGYRRRDDGQDSTSVRTLLGRGFALEYATLGWNVVGIVVLAFAAVAARSVARVGFGLDSLIEIGASIVVVWELSGSGELRQRRALRLIAIAFALLALYLVGQSTVVLVAGAHPRHSPLGIAWTAVTALVMFALAAGKTR